MRWLGTKTGTHLFFRNGRRVLRTKEVRPPVRPKDAAFVESKYAARMTRSPEPVLDASGSRRRGGITMPSLTLWHREMIRFFRQRHRVVSALLTPIVLWVLLGSGLNDIVNVQADGHTPDGYRAYFFTGTLTMVLLYTAIFSTITVIEDRKEGFLQSVLVAPVPRTAIVLGKVLGGSTIAMIHGLLFLLLRPIALGWPSDVSSGLVSTVAAASLCLVMAIGLTALGLCIAWPMDSTTGFHAVMMLFLMPMWFLSGAVFPLAGAPRWLQLIMWCNPMTYGQAALTGTLREGRTGMPLSTWQATATTTVLSTVMVLLAVAMVRRQAKEVTT